MQTLPKYDPHAAYNARIEADLKAFYSTELGMLDRAVSAFTQGKATLYRPDGQPKYIPDEMREREAALLAALDEVIGRVGERAEEAIAAARQELEVLTGADPWDRLTESERTAATARQPFVKEDVEQLPYARLAELARAAIVANDRAAMYLWWRYGSRRLAPPAARTGGFDSVPSVRSEPASPARRAFVEALREIEATLSDPKAAEKKERAERKVSMGQVLQFRAKQARLDLDGTMDRARDEMRQRMAL
jgi:hypothetical protein